MKWSGTKTIDKKAYHLCFSVIGYANASPSLKPQENGYGKFKRFQIIHEIIWGF